MFIRRIQFCLFRLHCCVRCNNDMGFSFALRRHAIGASEFDIKSIPFRRTQLSLATSHTQSWLVPSERVNRMIMTWHQRPHTFGTNHLSDCECISRTICLLLFFLYETRLFSPFSNFFWVVLLLLQCFVFSSKNRTFGDFRISWNFWQTFFLCMCW